MFCKTSPQLSLFDVNNVFPNALPKEDWCYLYRDQIYPLIDEASYRGSHRHHQYLENTDYRKQGATRAGAEGTVREMVRSHGVRKSRHRTESRTRLQLLFAAIGRHRNLAEKLLAIMVVELLDHSVPPRLGRWDKP